jgi:pyruvate kinase
MLSGESASGDFPLEAAQVMFKVAHAAELDFNHSSAYMTALGTSKTKNAESAYMIAKDVLTSDVKFIIAFSEKGRLVNALSTFRPKTPIMALIKDKNLINKYGSTYGVYAQYHSAQNDYSSDAKVRAIASKMGISKGAKVLVANKSEFRLIRV